MATTSHDTPRVLVVGAGQAGMHVARRLRRRLRPGEAAITVVDPHSYSTYQPLLAEAAAGNLEPRHVVVPLRQVLPGVEVITRAVISIDHSRRTAYVASGSGEPEPLGYDVLVLAPGSVTRVLPVPGLAEGGIGFKTVGEAIHLRNHVLAQLDTAASARSDADRERALTFVFVGGGYAGVEALAELQDMAHDACRHYPGIDPARLRWVLVEATGRILPEVGERMGRYTVDLLQRRGIDVRLDTRLTSVVDGHLVLDDGSEFDAGTLVWTAGVAPHPLLKQTDMPLDERGRVLATKYLSVVDTPDAWALGDCAAVPDLARGPGAVCPPSAQHAVRQARVAAGNVIATLRGRTLKPYRHTSAGSVASLGLYQGVAQVYRLRLRGLPAWLAHRTYHLLALPTWNRRLRVVADWTLALLFPREIVSLEALEHARDAFTTAAEETAGRR
ncbi:MULTISPECIES: NAD(P)/FAD-dependent oxidoreductase [Amycolatopsis]|uniref:NAD(P)/FAD-dependent oxidoreductase n=2 Tax=Amycolatopsis TaxID=1813 RepID=A0A5C4LWG7_9PSEU|nr:MULTISPECIES: NAD(P)/FAD-dependent oxidoreductase [Amycolatopsis]PKV99901.1 NADH dehydrogenase [Amycolatopsis niigatensis]TNC23792.1 NAD(P)/FAD-dependent oxidoreductase [Amycolatopsis alkalitolerans]